MIIDKSKDIHYETHSFIMKILRFFLLPIFNFLPEGLGRKLFVAWGEDTKKVQRNVRSYIALERLYLYNTRLNKPSLNDIDGCVDFFWHSFLANAKAVRNRLRLVKRELKKAILDLTKSKKDIYLFSLGSGSARAVIEVLSEFKDKTFSIHVKLLDLSRNALAYSKDLAKRFGVDSNIEYIRGYVQNLEKYCDGFTPDIVEMVGLLDYFDRNHAIDIIHKIHSVLSPGGIMITGNIRNNIERPFVTKAIGWSLIYRSESELAEIVEKGGFRPDHCLIIYEAMRIHGLAICRKKELV